MKILISNDDGYGAPGVEALKSTLALSNDVWYSLPDRDRSGASQSLTLHRPIKVIRKDDTGIVVEGTPADCVRLSLSGLCPFEPDLVVSGINSGANLGTDVLYSGTVAAAMEGVLAGVPAIAFSLTGSRFFDTAAYWSNKIVEHFAFNNLPNDYLLNVNIPDIPRSEVKGFKFTEVGRRDFSKILYKTADPRSKERYWIGLPGDPVSVSANSDFKAISEGYVSITGISPERFARIDCAGLFEGFN